MRFGLGTWSGIWTWLWYCEGLRSGCGGGFGGWSRVDPAPGPSLGLGLPKSGVDDVGRVRESGNRPTDGGVYGYSIPLVMTSGTSMSMRLVRRRGCAVNEMVLALVLVCISHHLRLQTDKICPVDYNRYRRSRYSALGNETSSLPPYDPWGWHTERGGRRPGTERR
jgi:hypothetical protein